MKPCRAIAVGPLAALLLAGCADLDLLRRKCPLAADAEAVADRPAPDAAYRVGCPDVLEVTFADRPEWDAAAAVDLDGRLPLGRPESPRVEGLTLREANLAVAKAAGVPADRVALQLAAPRSGRVYLHGPVRGRLRVLAYQGPEPVIDFLRRVGGLPPGSKLSNVHVVRPNVAAGARPELFHIDVEAVLGGNGRTNLALRPSDQVYVGETRRSSFSRALPDWVGPAYRKLSGLLPDDWWPCKWPKRDAATMERG